MREDYLIGIISVVRDITDRKIAEEKINNINNELEIRVIERTKQLEEINKELESFTYSVSHDLRAPLRAIDGFSHILIEKYKKSLNSEELRILDFIRNNTKKMDQLIFDLLSISKVTSTDMKMQIIDMNKLVNSVYEEIVSQEDKDKITFSTDKLPLCYGDLILIRQVWVNLIANAVKFTKNKQDRVINIQGFMDNEKFIYTVKDNGAGFNPEYKHKLFNAFQRLHTNG